MSARTKKKAARKFHSRLAWRTWGGHTLTVGIDEWFGPEEHPTYSLVVSCTQPERCTGWTICEPAQPCHNDMVPPNAPWDEEREIHSQPHTWRWGYGWTVPFDGCVVAENVHCWNPESALEIAYDHGIGVHAVYDDWGAVLYHRERLSHPFHSPEPLDPRISRRRR